MKLTALAAAAGAQVLQPAAQEVKITGITCDSRLVRAGDLFAALPGVKADGRAFARQAAEHGAAAILCEGSEPLTTLPQLVCADARLGLARAARAFHGCADRGMRMGAVTGTNGKSTTAYLVRHLMRSAGKRCGMLGTIKYDLGLEVIDAPLTTPESLDLHRHLRAMADSNCDAAFMEVSSHSLCQHRVAGISFCTAVFPNLTRDHLDYHRTMENYRAAKGILFRGLPSNAVAVLNLDDKLPEYRASELYASITPARVLGFTLDHAKAGKSGLFARIRKRTIHGTVFEIESPWGKREVNWPLVGAHNVENCLGALGAVVALGASFDQALTGLASFQGVPGRLESVGDGEARLPFRVLVDYAHTDDALRSVMSALNELQPTRLITVFGCGGDRDRTKRPLMGKAVEDLANIGVVTSDNPRSENPQAIIADIWKGIEKKQKFFVEPDRAKAIEMAIREARGGDVVLIAGKGHENYQICGQEKRHFSDVEQARAALARRFGAADGNLAAAG